MLIVTLGKRQKTNSTAHLMGEKTEMSAKMLLMNVLIYLSK